MTKNVVEHDPAYLEDEDIEESEQEIMSDEDILSLCSYEIQLAAGYDDDELVSNRTKALDYYFGRPNGKELEGRSEAQSMDVADMTEATLAEIMPLYANPNLASFVGFNSQDDDQAKLESKYCNHQFMELSSGWDCLYQAVKDGLLQRNGQIDVYIQKQVKPKYSTFVNLSDIELHEINNNPDAEIIEWDESEGKFTITVREYTVKKKLVAEAFPPEDFLFTVNHRTHNPSEMRFCARRIITTESDLISQGYDPDIIENLSTYTENINIDSDARNQIEDEDEFDIHKSSRYVEIYKCYVMMDYDGDGIDELHRVIIGGGENGEILDREWVNNISFSSGSPFLMSHRFIGMSLFDKIQQTQDSKTFFLRQWHDNANHMNNRRLEVVENQVEMEDVLNSRPGGAIRTKSRGVVNPIPVDDIGPSCQLALDYLDKMRSERGGASLDMQTSEMAVGERVGSQGVDRQYASKEKMAALIARTFAETLIKQTYLLVHATLREFMTQEIEFPNGKSWLKTDPSKWLERDAIIIDVGMSLTERKAQVTSLSSTLTLQQTALEKGADGVLTDHKKIYNTIMDISYASGLQNPERYWIDPNSPEAQKALQQKQESAKAQDEENKIMQRMIFDYQREIEAQKDRVKVLEQKNKRFLQKDKQLHDLIKHNDILMKEYTALELEHDVDIQGQGAGE